MMWTPRETYYVLPSIQERLMSQLYFRHNAIKSFVREHDVDLQLRGVFKKVFFEGFWHAGVSWPL